MQKLLCKSLQIYIDVNCQHFSKMSQHLNNHKTKFSIKMCRNAGDRVKRVANHLFNEGSFYPLNPSSDKLSVDSALTQQFAALSTVPNILILRSAAKCFAREVKRPNERGCLVLNPGSMHDNSTNGTFSRLIVTPSTDDTAALNSIIACQIIKI